MARPLRSWPGGRPAPLRDLTVAEPDIEEVVRRLYAVGRDGTDVPDGVEAASDSDVGRSDADPEVA